MSSLLAVKAAARKSAAAEQAYNDADNYYRRGDYQNSYLHLQQAKQDAACTEQITRINNGLNMVTGKLQGVPTAPPPTDTAVPPATAQTTGNPVCQQYQRQLTELGNRQQRLAAQAQQIRTQDQARSLQASVTKNSRQMLALIDQARAAGCHDTDIPPEVRNAMGMSP